MSRYDAPSGVLWIAAAVVGACALADLCLGADGARPASSSGPDAAVAVDASAPSVRPVQLRRVVVPPFGEARTGQTFARNLYARALDGDAQALDEYLTDVEDQLDAIAEVMP